MTIISSVSHKIQAAWYAYQADKMWEEVEKFDFSDQRRHLHEEEWSRLFDLSKYHEIKSGKNVDGIYSDTFLKYVDAKYAK